MASERIVNTLDQCVNDMTLYGVYVARHRSVPDYRDGLKEVQRRILYAMFKDFNYSRMSKSSAIIGTVMHKYHPHGDSAIYGAMKPLANWFEIYKPLITTQGNFGDFQGSSPAASRYTEAKLSQFAIDVLFDELAKESNVVDWESNYSGDESITIPKILPSKLPLLLINGCFGIAVGFKSDVPSHNINEVIDATLALLDNPKAKINLIPDPIMNCDVIESDWKAIADSGFGSYKVRGKIDIGEYKNKPALFIHSLPNMVYLDSISEKIEKLITAGKLPQVVDLYENSKDTQLEYIIVLKKGSDPVFVRDVLYKETELEKTFRVNFEVLSDKQLIMLNYRSYILNFLNFRRQTKLRYYRNIQQKLMTKKHILEFLLLAITSGIADKMIDLIKKSKAENDSEIIEYILKAMNKIAPNKNYTSTQVKRFINMPVKYFSKTNVKRYQEELKECDAMLKVVQPLTFLNGLDDEIRKELIELKRKYGEKRRSKVISQSDISNIPQGTFRIIITDENKVKKFGVDENIRYSQSDNIIMTIENTDNIILFDDMGRVFSIPVHKIPLTERGSNGIDIRSINKRIVSNIIVAVSEKIIQDMHKKKHFTIMVLSESGNIKRMLLDDFISVPYGGLIYSKLDNGDRIKRIIFIQGGNIVVYSDNKALCFDSNTVPILRRNTKGLKAIHADYVDGMSVVSHADCLIVVTKDGYVNKINVGALKVKKRAMRGDNVIKLSSGDHVVQIYSANNTDTLQLQFQTEAKDIKVVDLPEGTSLSKGTRFKNLIKSILRR